MGMMFKNGVPYFGNPINDETCSENSVWSSTKTSEEITKQISELESKIPSSDGGGNNSHNTTGIKVDGETLICTDVAVTEELLKI